MFTIATLLDDLSLKDIAPPSVLPDSNIQAVIQALDPEFRILTKDIHEVSLLSRIDDLDEKALDLLAWQFHADFYDLAATLRMKREAVRNALTLHMKKGTEWAIKEALRQLDIEAEFVPWWESGGEPYTFGLRAIVGGEFYRTSGKDTLIRNIYRAVNEAKSARSLLVSLHTEITDCKGFELYSAVIPFLSGELYIRPKAPEASQSSQILSGLAGALSGWKVIALEHEHSLNGKIFAGVAAGADTDLEIGVDLDTMQELLLRFEDRIFTRINEHEQSITDQMESMNANIMTRLDEIEKLLKWAGNDESFD